MRRLESERRKNVKSQGTIQSAYQRHGLSSASTRIVDLTTDQVKYGMRPSTAIQLDQIKAINEFNKALPKKKQNMALPMISSTNIGYTNSIKRDHKKKTVELLYKYNPVGLVEDHFQTGDDLDDSKFSFDSKVRALSQQQSRKRISVIRQHSGNLIGANKLNKHDFIDNVFAHGSQNAMSISLYNKQDKALRPMTAPIGKNGEPMT